ncbi:MAG TPA: hypothetical protein PK357_00130 [Candidatus Pacearchaeota archaeon]|nr:hypothetical protein [Candidatus Pacearchaeota archaeon]
MRKLFNRKKNKKGELTTEQIVGLTILIASFVILIIYIAYMQFNKQTNDEACRASVVLRGGIGETTPLSCQREFVCITQDGSCEGMSKPEIKKVKTEYEVYDVLAEEMRDCWLMFGEGNINYVKDRLTRQNLCSICDQIFFDNSVKNVKGFSGTSEIYPFANGKINKDEFYKYLSANKMPDSDKDLTYSQYIFNVDNFDDLKSGLSSNAGKQVTFGTIEIEKNYLIVMGITTEVNDITWALGGAVIVGAGVLTAGFIYVPLSVLAIPGVVFSGVLVGEAAGGAIGLGAKEISELFSPEINAILVEGGEVENKFMAPTIVEADSNKFKFLECKEIISG